MTLPPPSCSLGPLDIARLLPHRHPFLWVDTVDILEVGRRARGTKAVTMSEPVFQGHFPAEPIFPGVLITEALAQTGAILLGHARGAAEPGAAPAGIGYVVRTDIKFIRPVTPGHLLRLDVKLIGQTGNMFAFNCVAGVDGVPAVEGRIAITTPAQEGAP